MIALALAVALAQSPTMAGAPVSAISGRGIVDYTTSLYLTAPSGAALCDDVAITTDQGAAITVTRASAASCEVAAGNIVQLSNNSPIVEALGIGVWPASSNRIDYSVDPGADWTATNATLGVTAGASPSGASILPLATTAAGGYYESNAFTITGTSAVLSIFIKGTGTESVNARLRDTTAGADRCTISVTAPASWPAQLSRPSCAASGTIVSGNNHVVRVYPGGTGGESSTDVYFADASVEPGLTVMTPYILTSGTAASRAVDNISTTIANINTGGCFGATFWSTVAAFPRSVATNPSTFAQFNNTATMLLNDGTNTATSNSVSNMTNRSTAVRAFWAGSSMRIGLDGSLGTAATFDGDHVGTTTLYIGSLSGTSRHLGGFIKSLKVSTDSNGCQP